MIDRVRVVDRELPTTGAPSPGQVVKCDGKDLWLATGDGTLAIQELHPAGKRVMTVPDFLRGYPVQVGDLFAH